MRRTEHLLWIPLALTLLSGCGRQDRPVQATQEATLEFAQLQEDLSTLAEGEWLHAEEAAEIATLLQHFAQTADARYATPETGLTMLHLACMLKKPELARSLLRDGADPNARTKPTPDNSCETPLTLAISTTYITDPTAEPIIRLIDILLEHGATLPNSGSDLYTLTLAICLTDAPEEVFLHLLDKGIPRDNLLTAAAAYQGWPNALNKLLAGKKEIDPSLLPAAANLRLPGDHLQCIRLLLEKGIPVDATDPAGRTALYLIASTLQELEEESDLQESWDIITLLLEHGADPLKPAGKSPETPGFCAADYLYARSETLNYLAEKGYNIEPPRPTFQDKGSGLLSDIWRASIRPDSPLAYAQDYDAIATILTPSEEIKEQENYPQTLPLALNLLASIQAEKTSRLVESMPLWQDIAAWEREQPECDALIEGLLHTPAITLSEHHLLHTAEALEKAGKHHYAAALAELLARCPLSPENIERYCTDPRPSIQAGAWQARLRQLGLPSAHEGAVEEWLQTHATPPYTEAQSTALLLTSLDKLWYGELGEKDREAIITHLRELGAPHAADAIQALAGSLSNPEQLDRIMEKEHEWIYEQQIAIARYIFTHRQDFQPAQKDS